MYGPTILRISSMILWSPGAAFQIDHIACAMQKEKHAVQLALVFFHSVLKLFQDIIERIVSDRPAPAP